MAEEEEQQQVWGPGFERLIQALQTRPCPVPFQLQGSLAIGDGIFYIRDGALVSEEEVGAADLEADEEAVMISVVDGHLTEEYEGTEDLIRIWKHFDRILGHNMQIRLDFAVGSMYILLASSCVFAPNEIEPRAPVPVDSISLGVKKIIRECEASVKVGHCAGHSGTCPEIVRHRVPMADVIKAQALIAIEGPPDKICEYVTRLAPTQTVGVCVICKAWITHAEEQAAVARQRRSAPPSVPRAVAKRAPKEPTPPPQQPSGGGQRSNFLRPGLDRPPHHRAKPAEPQFTVLPDKAKDDGSLDVYKPKPFDRRFLDPSVKHVQARKWGHEGDAPTPNRVYA